MRERRGAFLLLLLFSGCSSPLAPHDSAEETLARQDHEAITRLMREAAPPAGRESPGRRIVGLSYQALVLLPVSHAVSAGLASPIALANDLIVASLFPVMGSKIQDAIDDTAFDVYREGASFGRIWRSIPSVSDESGDLYERDLQGSAADRLSIEVSSEP